MYILKILFILRMLGIFFFSYVLFSLPNDPNIALILAVTAVANSLEAWKILEDLTNHIDLVLMEVVMPYLSGIGLLRKIMSHKTFKNIPVISEYCPSFFYWKFYLQVPSSTLFPQI